MQLPARLCQMALAITAIHFTAHADPDLGQKWQLATKPLPWDGRADFSVLSYDGKMWIMGGRDPENRLLNDVWCSENGRDWRATTDSAAWPVRWRHESVVFDGKMWVIGGIGTWGWPQETRRDLWFSYDGSHWEKASDQFPGYSGPVSCLAFEDKIWLFRGESGNQVYFSHDGRNWDYYVITAQFYRSLFLDATVHGQKMWVFGMGGSYWGGGRSEGIGLWSSSDGTSWTKVASPIPWYPHIYYTALTYSDAMWVLGGWRGTGYSSSRKVWKSADGVDWTETTSTAPWNEQCKFLAHDGKIWAIGTTTQLGNVWSSTDGTSWTEIHRPAEWSPRCGHTTIVHNDKLWVVGGDNTVGDVWCSQDGRIWTSATLTAPWNSRRGHASVVYEGKVWVIGGKGTNGVLNDVWYSPDGTSWTLATDYAPWSARYGHTAAVFDGRIWIIGGRGESETDFNDVWSTVDGTSWTLATDNAGWKPRFEHASVVSQDMLWILGGASFDGEEHNLDDVWSSANGTSWTKVSLSGKWSIPGDGLSGHCAVAVGDLIYLIGGKTEPNKPVLNEDIWYTQDGMNWYKVFTWNPPPWSKRFGHTCTMFEGKLWLLGGCEGFDTGGRPLMTNDVWYSEGDLPKIVTASADWQMYP